MELLAIFLPRNNQVPEIFNKQDMISLQGMAGF